MTVVQNEQNQLLLKPITLGMLNPVIDCCLLEPDSLYYHSLAVDEISILEHCFQNLQKIWHVDMTDCF